MNKFSVIGFYEDSYQTFLDHIKADTIRKAKYLCARARPDSTIVCALPGYITESDGTISFAGSTAVDASTIIEQPDVFDI